VLSSALASGWMEENLAAAAALDGRFADLPTGEVLKVMKLPFFFIERRPYWVSCPLRQGYLVFSTSPETGSRGFSSNRHESVFDGTNRLAAREIDTIRPRLQLGLIHRLRGEADVSSPPQSRLRANHLSCSPSLQPA
jgi:hypothetical protein